LPAKQLAARKTASRVSQTPTSTSRTRAPVRTPPDPFVVAQFGSWAIFQIDPTKKRGWARCGHCAAIHEISLVDGVPRCGCSASRSITMPKLAFVPGLPRARS